MRSLPLILLCGSLLTVSAPLFAQASPNTATGKKQDLISRADTNGDGKVSRDEFLAYKQAQAEKEFDRLDRNKDGFIEKSELGAAKRRHRTKQ